MKAHLDHFITADRWDHFLQEIAEGSYYFTAGVGGGADAALTPSRSGGRGSHVLEFLFPRLFADPNCFHAGQIRPRISSRSPGTGVGQAALIACVPVSSLQSPGQGHSHRCFQNHLNRGAAAPS